MANRKTKSKNVGQRKLSKAQMEAKQKAAEEAQKKQAAAKERAERSKKIFTVVICVILVLALGIPTVALTVLGSF
ncbi:MAG: CASC3 protein CASC3 [Phoenicibacter congonensis]|uniref:CASC3 protein CASC3 n=1 Tax=Phoenicibacter congonensis TaxID=1944646 RepID=A0AA43RJX3_9ACTN|nr:CASC3 protein CASC3 [Phoenicibacter congonensis]